MGRFFVRQALAVAIIAAAGSAYAYDFKSGELYYNIVEGGAEVTHPVDPETGKHTPYVFDNGAVAVPATVSHDGGVYAVKAIGKEAFRYCNTISTISLPEGLSAIEYAAFDNSTVKSIGFPETLTEINGYAFQYCLELAGTVIVPDNVTRVGAGAFAGCPKIREVSLGSGVMSVGADIFGGGFWGTRPTGLGGLEKLWHYTRLVKLTCKSVVPPKAEGNIVGQDGQTGVVYAAPLYVPAQSVDMYRHAPQWDVFTDVTGDPALSDRPGTKTIRDNKIDYTLHLEQKTATVRNGSQGIASAVIPQTIADEGTEYTVTAVGPGAFAYYDRLTSVSLPETVTEIGQMAFAECAMLATANLPGSLTSVGAGAFKGCAKLEAVSLPETLAGVGDEAFESCSGIQSVYLSGTEVKIGRRAFAKCPALAAVRLDNCVEIGEEAFSECPALTDVKLSDKLEAIPAGLFYEARGLAEFSMPASVTAIGERAFCLTGITSIKLPEGLAEVAPSTFRGTQLREIEIPASVSAIGDYSFYRCTNLSSVTIKGDTEQIGGQAFASCTALQSVDIQGATKAIGRSAFADCTSLASLSVADLNAWATTEFADEASNPMLWTKSISTGGRPVTQLNLDLGDRAVSTFAFKDCETLATARIKASKTSSRSFTGCKNLTDICLDVSLLEEESFDNWPMNVYVDRDVPPVAASTAFSEYEYSAGWLCVPAGTRAAYKAVTTSWGKFTDIAEKDFSGLDEIFGESGIEDIEAVTPQGRAVYYDLRGVRVSPDGLAPGIYIKRQGDRSSKVVIR